MLDTFQTLLPKRPAAAALALVLFAGFTAPFVLLQHAKAEDAVLQCTEGNHNGCTELSPVPPEDPQAVAPNVVLMLDDSGSMNYDYMPDWEDLANTSSYGTRNSGINAVYYNPATTYTPPPKATGNTEDGWQDDTSTWYPNSPGITDAYLDGFTSTSTRNIVDYNGYQATTAANNGHPYNYTEWLKTTLLNTSPPVDKGPATWGGGTAYQPGHAEIPGSPGGGCIAGYYLNPTDSTQCLKDPTSATHNWSCNSGDGSAYDSGGTMMCHHRVWEEGVQVDHPYNATDSGYSCPAASTGPNASHMCPYPPIGTIPPTATIPATDPIPATPDYKWICQSGGSFSGDPEANPPPATPPECWTSGSSQPIYVKAFTYVVGNPVSTNRHYVVPDNPAFYGGTASMPDDGWCSVVESSWQKANCVGEGDSTGTAAPSGIKAGQNVANWFSYYRTRMLMAKSSLMTALASMNPKYRVGYASINATALTEVLAGAGSPYTFDDAMDGGGNANNKLAGVYPFGNGASGTQKANFWAWLAKVAPSGNTPLRKALQGAGEYYKTSDPWKAMVGDPGYTTGSTTKFACRASYTILTTDGFWNGADPSGIAAASSTDGPVWAVPAGNITQYKAVAPYTGGTVGGDVPSLADVATYYWENDLNTDFINEVATSTSDPASWQHMTTFTVGMGYNPVGILPTTANMAQIFTWARGGAAISGFSWPTPASNSLNNIADLAHAAVNGHGDFFNASNPEQMAAAFSKALTDIGARNVAPAPAAVNASVLAIGSMTFSTGYNTGDWSGTLQGVTLKTNGTVDSILWKAHMLLDSAYHSPTAYSSRKVYTGSYDPAGTGTYSTFQFNVTNKASLDSTETAGLKTPALAGGDDTLDNRIKYLLGDNTYEGALTGTAYRARTSILGAIIRSDPVYVSTASGGYRDSWPTTGGSAPPEAATTAQPYSAFVAAQATRHATVYVGANDGMLHAFYAPVPTCTGTINSSGDCSAYTSASGAGQESWAFMPRAVYANLGNLTDIANFSFLPTVDATPATRDVFSTGDKKWHTLLTGGVGLGGRGVYGIDVTTPDPSDATNPFGASKVLWEFDADMKVDTGCVTTYGSCRGTDLGYTLSQPNIGRLANNKWVVLMPNGYFPDCLTPDFPTKTVDDCKAVAAQAPKDSSGKPYSALFVLDAMTGKMIAELKTPTDISGVTSFGLATPVLGDYNSDQVDDVAFAGDVEGNLWRFDLSDPSPSNWNVTLVYQGTSTGGKQGVQPITSMPRLFPDPTTNRFIVAFGTGKYLGIGDNSNNTEQAIYGVRDVDGVTYSQGDLTQQYLHESVVPDGETNAGATLRCVTGASTDTCSTSATAINALPTAGGGWFIKLKTTDSAGHTTDTGERVVVNPAAVFASNTVIFQSLITGAENIDACNPSTQGAILALSATSGAPAGVSSLGPWPVAGGRISNARTRGSLPLVSPVSGGKAYLPTALLSPSGTSPIAVDAPIPRRRSWRELLNGQ